MVLYVKRGPFPNNNIQYFSLFQKNLILKNLINKMEEWLKEKISKYSDDSNEDLVINLFQELLLFLNKSEDIYLEDNLETFEKEFYNLIYNKYS